MKTVFAILIFLFAAINNMEAQNKEVNTGNDLRSGELVITGEEGKDLATLEREGKLIRQNGIIMYCKDGCRKYLENKNKPEEKPKSNNVAGNQPFFSVPKISDQIN